MENSADETPDELDLFISRIRMEQAVVDKDLALIEEKKRNAHRRFVNEMKEISKEKAVKEEKRERLEEELKNGIRRLEMAQGVVTVRKKTGGVKSISQLGEEDAGKELSESTKKKQENYKKWIEREDAIELDWQGLKEEIKRMKITSRELMERSGYKSDVVTKVRNGRVAGLGSKAMKIFNNVIEEIKEGGKPTVEEEQREEARNGMKGSTNVRPPTRNRIRAFISESDSDSGSENDAPPARKRTRPTRPTEANTSSSSQGISF